MSGFVRHCVITKECPETFLLFLYKTPLFPRLVQVLRICFLSLSLPPCVSLPPSLSLSLFVETHEYHKGWFIGELQYKLSVFKSAKSKSPSEKPLGRHIQPKVVSCFQRINSNRRFMETNTQHGRVE